MPEYRLPLNSTESHEWFQGLPEIARGYIEAAFFCGITFFPLPAGAGPGEIGDPEAEPLEIDGLGPSNLDAGARAGLEAIAARFWIEHGETLARATASGAYDLEQAGRDLWFTSGGHGVGFWCREELEPETRDALSAAARAVGEADLFPVPLDLETGRPFPGFHVDYSEAATPGAEPDPDDSDAWRVFLSMPVEPLSEIERAALRALEAGAEPGAVAREVAALRRSEAVPVPGLVREAEHAQYRENVRTWTRAALEALETGAGGAPAASPLPDVSGARGAPCGRSGAPLDADADRITARRIILDAGGYDSGGAYWGLGSPLWEVTDGAGGSRFVRAETRADAIGEALEPDPAALDLARRHGWRVVPEDPRGYAPGVPCLYHAEQERAWPIGDARGALLDLGLEPGEIERADGSA